MSVYSSVPSSARIRAAVRLSVLVALSIALDRAVLYGQSVSQYVVTKTSRAMTIDGRLTEPEWAAAAVSAKFVHHTDGSAARLSTQAKFLWDDANLYIGFICEDPDVWATMKNRDESLWKGEVVEIFLDPDGDGLNYAELEINPLGTILDLMMTKAYTAGGKADMSWSLNFKASIGVEGTLNDSSDTDQKWYCEVALPFKELAFMAPSLSFPPKEGDAWRILLARYDYERTGSKRVETSAWSPTNSTTFHVPEKFGRIVFSGASSVGVAREQTNAFPQTFALGSYPNPFNPSTTIRYAVPSAGRVGLAVYDAFGRTIAVLVDKDHAAGSYEVTWKADNIASGLYFTRLSSGAFSMTRTLLLLR